MALTDKAIKAAKPQDKHYKLADSEGMYLLVSPKGAMTWYLKYRHDGKEKKLHLGQYPEVPLIEARDRRQEAKKTLRQGRDPALFSNTGADTFNDVAIEWYGKNKDRWSDRHAERVDRAIKEMRPFIGSMKMTDIEATDILVGVQSIEKRNALTTALKTKQAVAQVFYYAIATGRAKRNPATDLRGALKPRPAPAHYAHLDAKDIPAFIRALREYRGTTVTRIAAWFLLTTFVRTKEMRYAEWSEFDLDGKEWRIPADRMKMSRPHIVPLSTQAVALLRELYAVSGKGRLLFPQPRKPDKPISEVAVLTVIAAIGYKDRVTGHGFRGTASTILHEVGGFPTDAIERQLAHVEGNKSKAAYNHAEYLPQRREMMQWWADYLEASVQEAIGK